MFASNEMTLAAYSPGYLPQDLPLCNVRADALGLQVNLP
jgi:hypothetical protein